MAVYVTKKCPHCGHAYQIHQSGEQRKYGCPYQTCTRCNKSYWDPDIKEPALHGYKNAYETRKSIVNAIMLIFLGLCALICLASIPLMIISREIEIILIFLALMGVGFVWMIVSFIKEKVYVVTHQDEIIEKQQKGYDDSLMRLKNNDYLAALAKHDSLAMKLLKERNNNEVEHYAERPMNIPKDPLMRKIMLMRIFIEMCVVFTSIGAVIYLTANGGDIMVAKWLGEIWCLLACSIIFLILGLLSIILNLKEKLIRQAHKNSEYAHSSEKNNIESAPANATMTEKIKMSEAKEKIVGAVTIMRDDDAEKIWHLIQDAFALKNVPVTEPDEWDLQMLREIESDPDCHEFIPASQAMKELGL